MKVRRSRSGMQSILCHLLLPCPVTKTIEKPQESICCCWNLWFVILSLGRKMNRCSSQRDGQWQTLLPMVSFYIFSIHCSMPFWALEAGKLKSMFSRLPRTIARVTPAFCQADVPLPGLAGRSEHHKAEAT